MAIAAWGCSPAPAYTKLRYGLGPVSFASDEATVAVLEPARAYGYDLRTRSTRWRYVATQPNVGVSFSPRGAFAAVVESADQPRGFTVTVLRGDGKRLFRKNVPHALSPGDSSRFTARAPSLFSVSDDGALLACGVFQTLQVFDVASGALLATETIERGLDTVAFQPGTHRLAFGSDFEPRLRIGEIQGNPAEGPKLVTLQIFEAGFDPVWTSTGLFFGSPRGIERWDGKAAAVVVGPAQAFPDGRAAASWFAPPWAASPDGAYVAAWNRMGVTVFRTADGRPLFAHAEPQAVEHDRLWQVAFLPTRFRAFTEAGDFIELEIPTGRLLKRISFGEPGSSSRALFTDGVVTETSYSPSLSPSGRFVAISWPEGGSTIYVTDAP